ncbi:protein kinase [Mycobacterium sp. AMU20-3851]|uniref:protein kinase domain-containing protein n=1 Tax=Mycobacterium sp. AMU20-3851 TaxID=3122055 RepID=UPI003754C4DD
MGDIEVTQQRSSTGIVAELEAEGFEVAEPVGRGGFGVVYRCRQPSMDRVVAIKVLNSDPDDMDIEQFNREQRAMGRVSGHPNIVPVLHGGLTFAGRPYIVMPYYRRDNLGAWVKGHGPMALEEVLPIGVRLAGALETAHRAGVLHRDVKPPNVLLTDYGEPQLSDFGIARIAGARDLAKDVVAGSPSYTAPELYDGGAPSVAADVYGLAATLFALLHGRPPFVFEPTENVVAFVRRVQQGPIPDLRPAGVPEAVASALEAGLQIDPARRPASAVDFGESLRAAGAEIGLVIAEVPLELPPVADAAGLPVGVEPPMRVTGGSSGGRRRYPPSAPTRFRPPPCNRPTVARTRILDRLRSTDRSKLVLIHAPAGYGKSTLAAQWADQLIREGLSGAWLAIDADDNNVGWFLAHLIEAIRTTMPDLADILQQELDGHLDNAPTYVLNTLITRLHEDKRTLVLILDDWHRAESQETTDALCYLVENSCHHLHLIVASRTRPVLPLGTLRVQGELVEIDASQLRFDTAESASMLVDQCGITLSADHIAAIEEHTDGWAAALQLASLSLREQAEPAAVIGQLTGRDTALGEYLASNVLDNLAPDVLDFLLATSIPKQICSGLATALTGHRRSRAMLEEIERRDLFLRRTDAQGSWFEYHHLFAEYLLHRLERDAEDRIPQLHRTAARWFTDNQMLSQAVDHLLLAGDPAVAVDTVEQVATDLMEQSRMRTLIGLADKLPAAERDARPRLQVDLAWANVVLHRLPAALDALRLAELGLDGLATDEAADLRAEIDLIRSVMAAFQDRIDPETIDAAVRACVARSDRLSPFILCRTADLASHRAVRTFAFDEALRWQRWGRDFHSRVSGALSASYGYCFAAIAANEQLDIAGAEAHLRHARRIALSESGGPSYVAKLAGSLLGELLYEHGEFEEAQTLLDQACELGAEGGLVDFMLACHGTGARLAAARGDLPGAQRRLTDGLEVARMLNLSRLQAGLLYESARIATLSGEPVTDAVACRIAAGATDDMSSDTAEFMEDAQIRLLRAGGSATALTEACERARARRRRVDRANRPRAYLRATVQLAGCLAGAGRGDDAADVLQPALKTCAALGLSRLLLDEDPLLVQIAHRAIPPDSTAAVHVRDFVSSLS